MSNIYWGFIRPKYDYYAKKWNINLISVSLYKKIYYTPQKVFFVFIFVLFGFGFVLEYRKKY